MKIIARILLICGLIIGCNTTQPVTSKSNDDLVATKLNDTVKIENDSIEYQIIIIEPGFNTWLASTARPEGYYSQKYMETRNIIFVNEWNARVTQPQRYNPSLYDMRIDYRLGIDYGYEVNYKLYNYFIYFQLTYNQKLGGFNIRI